MMACGPPGATEAVAVDVSGGATIVGTRVTATLGVVRKAVAVRPASAVTATAAAFAAVACAGEVAIRAASAPDGHAPSTASTSP